MIGPPWPRPQVDFPSHQGVEPAGGQIAAVGTASTFCSLGVGFGGTGRNACYALAGSFTGFLIRRYGVEAYRKFFRKTDALNFQSTFRKIFGVTFAKAEWQWRTQLLTTAVLKRRLQTHC